MIQFKYGKYPSKVANDPDVSLEAKGLLSIIVCNIHASKGFSWMSVEELALRSNKSKASVHRYLRELQDKGIIERTDYYTTTRGVTKATHITLKDNGKTKEESSDN